MSNQGTARNGAIPRPDLLDGRSPKGLEVWQLTREEGVPSSHIYMEAQIFTPDSRRFILHRSSHAHGSDKADPAHCYFVCELEEGGRLRPITEETGATAPSVSPDGRTLYYFVNETVCGGGRLTLKKVGMDGTGRETVRVLDGPPAGVTTQPSQIYPLSTISSDGRKLALSAFFGDGRTENAPWGLMVFDLANGEAAVVLQGQTWCNLHPQYSRSADPVGRRDILVQENHGNACDAQGTIVTLVSGAGADIHVVRDDGSDFRNLPWGRDGEEFCQGHQCWRGESEWAITSGFWKSNAAAPLIEGLACPFADHAGRGTPGGRRNDLTRTQEKPWYSHFATDRVGQRFVTDGGPVDKGGSLWTARLGKPGEDPLQDWTYLLNPKCSWKKGAHIHPFLSPDGTRAFFNSDESGRLEAYMIRLE